MIVDSYSNNCEFTDYLGHIWYEITAADIHDVRTITNRMVIYDSNWNYVGVVLASAWEALLTFGKLYHLLLSLRPRQQQSGYG